MLLIKLDEQRLTQRLMELHERAGHPNRFFALDRDNRWDRVQAAYDLMTLGKGVYDAETAQQAEPDGRQCALPAVQR